MAKLKLHTYSAATETRYLPHQAWLLKRFHDLGRGGTLCGFMGKTTDTQFLQVDCKRCRKLMSAHLMQGKP